MDKKEVIVYVEQAMKDSLQSFMKNYAFDTRYFDSSTIETRLNRMKEIRKYLEDNLK